jgi:hypothetical protein
MLAGNLRTAPNGAKRIRPMPPKADAQRAAAAIPGRASLSRVADVVSHHASDAAPSAREASCIKTRNAAPDFNQTRDLIRARIGRALLLAINSRWITRDELCREAGIDRRTLDNWINGHCDPSSWRLAVVGQVLGDWFWMHVYGGDVGIAMWRRLQDRIAQERRRSDLEYAAGEIEARALVDNG